MSEADGSDPEAVVEEAESEKEEDVLDREGFEKHLQEEDSSETGEDVPHVD